MKVIICGAGQVGWQIARHLASERNDVTVVDNNADLVRRATDSLDVQGVAGFASYPDVLERAGARDADMIIAATYSDEVNMVTCQVAHSVFSIPRKIARLRSQSYLRAIYSDLYRRDHVPIDVVISPEREVAAAALQRLSAPAAFDTERFLEGGAQLLGLVIDENCPIVNTPLRQLTDLFSTLRAVVVGVRRDGTLFAPEPEDQLFEGDSAYIMSHADDVGRTLEIFGKPNHKQERVVLIGGGNVGLMVARELESRAERVRAKVIEKNRKCAEHAAEALEKTIVLHGDGLDRDVLREAGVEDAELALCLPNDDKVNLLSGVMAKKEGAARSLCLVNNQAFHPVQEALDVDLLLRQRLVQKSPVTSGCTLFAQSLPNRCVAIGDASMIRTLFWNFCSQPTDNTHPCPPLALTLFLSKVASASVRWQRYWYLPVV